MTLCCSSNRTLAQLVSPELVTYAFFHPLQSQSKMENAEVLEMTVKRVEGCLLNRAQGIHSVSVFTREYAMKQLPVVYFPLFGTH